MPFDMAFDFRGTAGFVTDPSYGVPALGELYPHTYTNADGKSINAGLATGAGSALNRNATFDPIIAGMNFISNDGSGDTFQIDLSSGSAPGAGTYNIYLAMGDTGGGVERTHYFEVKDGTTQLIDGTGGGSGVVSSVNNLLDATLTNIPQSDNPWVSTPASKVFATNTAKVMLGHAAIGAQTCFAHFRLVLTAAASGSRAHIREMAGHVRRRKRKC